MHDPASPSRDVYAFGPYRLDPAEHRLLRDGQRISLSPKAFDLLAALVSRASHLVTKEQLLREVWPGTFVEEANLSYTVSVLRKALGDEREPYRYVETVPRRGYRFIGVIDDAGTGEPTPERVDVKVPVESEAPVSAGVAAPELSSSSGHHSFVGRHLLGLTAGALILMVLAASWWMVSSLRDPASSPASAVAAPEQLSIAVLSFSDLSPQRDQEYLS